MNRVLLGALLLAWSVTLGVGCGERASLEPPRHLVRIEQMKFSPETLTVRRGEVVEFSNVDLVPHTVTRSGTGGFDSGAISAGRSWSFIAEKTGEFRYTCTFHPTMTGRVNVVESSKPSLARTARPIEWCGPDEPRLAPANL